MTEHRDQPADGSGRGDRAAVAIRVDRSTIMELDLDEYRLALLWLVDFERDWDAFEMAAKLVVDGAAKAGIAAVRLRPMAEHLPALAKRGVDSLELLAARYWFRQEST